MKRQIYAIGDVHGCAAELEILLERLTIDENTLVIFLGDYVDRGPDSRRVIDLIIELKKSCEVVALMGNHEAMFLDFLERPESLGSGLFIMNGGGATLANYGGPDGSWEVPKAHVEFLKDLKFFYETESHFYVHAGVPLKKSLRELDPAADRETFLWTRGPFLNSDHNWGKIVVHGHTPNMKPERKPNRINIDTACVFGGQLTAYDVSNDKFISVERTSLNDAAPPVLTHSGLRIAVRFNGRIPVRAGKPGLVRFEFETLNYNQFGLLLREIGENCDLFVGDIIEGVIGDDHRTSVDFEGTIVRSDNRNGLSIYGVKIDRISTKNEPHGDKNWIKRPA
jgi:serine/threonine protein phosphatase 1